MGERDPGGDLELRLERAPDTLTEALGGVVGDGDQHPAGRAPSTASTNASVIAS